MPITDVEMGALMQRVDAMEKQLEQQGKMIAEMRDVILAARGSWKTLVIIGGFASLIGGLVTKFLPH